MLILFYLLNLLKKVRSFINLRRLFLGGIYMNKTVVSVLSIIVLSFLFCSVSAEAKTRTGGSRGTSSSYTKPSTSTPRTSSPKPSSSSTTNTTTKSSSYSALTTKYPKSTRYFSGGVLSKSLVFGTALLIINEANEDEPTYSDEEGNIYTLTDLEEMDVQIPEDEPEEEDLYSETVSFDENQTATETVVPEEIETASSFDDTETYYEEESNSFNWLWLIIPLAVVVIVGTFFRKTKR